MQNHVAIITLDAKNINYSNLFLICLACKHYVIDIHFTLISISFEIVSDSLNHTWSLWGFWARLNLDRSAAWWHIIPLAIKLFKDSLFSFPIVIITWVHFLSVYLTGNYCERMYNLIKSRLIRLHCWLSKRGNE